MPDGRKATEVAPLMCAGVTIWSAIEKAGENMKDSEVNQQKGLSIGIVGAGGGLGHHGVQFASKLGCDVVAVDLTKAVESLKPVVKSIEGPKLGPVYHSSTQPRKQSRRRRTEYLGIAATTCLPGRLGVML